MPLVIKNVRLAFADTLKEPEVKQGDKDTYEEVKATLLTEPGYDISELEKEVKRVALEAFPKTPFKMLKTPISIAADCVSRTTGEVYDGFETAGHAIKVKAYAQPKVRAADGKKELPASDLYNGLYVNAIVTPKAWTYKDKKTGMVTQGVRFTLHSLQRVKDGPVLVGGAVDTTFTPISEQEVDADAFLNSVRG